MKRQTIFSSAASAALVAGALAGTPAIAQADTTSTVAIAAGAAAIVGALLYDGSNHPYYVRDGHRYYVTQDEAHYYRAHHSGVVRNAYVPEREYPVARDPYHGSAGGHQDSHGNPGADHHDSGHHR